MLIFQAFVHPAVSGRQTEDQRQAKRRLVIPKKNLLENFCTGENNITVTERRGVDHKPIYTIINRVTCSQ